MTSTYKKTNKNTIYCYYAFFINGMVALVFGAIMPMLIEDYNIGYDKAGLLISAHSIGNLIASFVAGLLHEKFGRKISLIFFELSIFIGFLSLLILKNPIFLSIPFFLTGIGRGGISNMGNTIINDTSEGKPGPLNLLHTFFAIGAFLISFYSSFVLKLGFKWQYIVMTIIGLSGILIILFHRFNFEDVRAKNYQIENNKYEFFKKASFYISSGILFFYVGVEYAVNGWIVTYLKDTGIMSLQMSQLILSILWILMIVGRFGTVYISKKIDKRNILLTSSLGVTFFYILFMVSSNPKIIFLSVVGLGLCLSGIFPTTISNANTSLTGSKLGMGIILAVAGIGGILMPYLTGLVANIKGIGGGMALITVAVVFLLVFTSINKLVRD